LQVLLHPSPSMVLLSSQVPVVLSILLPSPQISVQLSLFARLVDLAHYHPTSIVQLELQPSPLILLKSSHDNLPKLNESPHTSVHVSGDVGEPPLHLYPTSSRHWELHPSLLFRFPSSHTPVTVLMRLPSPQISEH
jgi:hypothetical protein